MEAIDLNALLDDVLAQGERDIADELIRLFEESE